MKLNWVLNDVVWNLQIEYVPNMNRVHISSFVVYIVAVVFWMLIGMLLDRSINGSKKRSVQ